MTHFSVTPLNIRLLGAHQPLSAGKRYDLLCQSAGSRPPAVITWWRDGQRLEKTTETVSNFMENNRFLFISLLLLYISFHFHRNPINYFLIVTSRQREISYTNKKKRKKNYRKAIQIKTKKCKFSFSRKIWIYVYIYSIQYTIPSMPYTDKR